MAENTLFTPEMTTRLIAAYNTNNPSHRISDLEKDILNANPVLAAAVFQGGIQKLMAGGWANIQQLSNKPELTQLLTNRDMQAAIQAGVFTTGELAIKPPFLLKKASEEYFHNRDSAAHIAGILKLNKIQARGFENAVEDLVMHPQADVTPSSAQTPPPRPLFPRGPTRYI